MGRKGVSKRKKAKEKVAPVSGGDSTSSERKIENQPERLNDKFKTSPKNKKKH
jgi:hypothetical protein